MKELISSGFSLFTRNLHERRHTAVISEELVIYQKFCRVTCSKRTRPPNISPIAEDVEPENEPITV